MGKVLSVADKVLERTTPVARGGLVIWKARAVQQWENMLVLLYERHIVPRGRYYVQPYVAQVELSLAPSTDTFNLKAQPYMHTLALEPEESALEGYRLVRIAYVKSAPVMEEAREGGAGQDLDVDPGAREVGMLRRRMVDP